MRQNDNLNPSPSWPQSTLVVGCGLMGTSFALAVKRKRPFMTIVGVESNPVHKQKASALGVFQDVVDALPKSQHDLVVLATPVDVTNRLLGAFQHCAGVVIDICSVKQSICLRAADLGMRGTFAPTHPMAGLASQGPDEATPSLFEGRPWIVLRGWNAVHRVIPILQDTGARVVFVDDAQTHDQAMSAVSHTVHLVSLSTMQAYQAVRQTSSDIAQITGPGFRDVTRLSGSPPGFWVSTLLENRAHVLEQMARVQHALAAFEDALMNQDAERLTELLQESHQAHRQWAAEHEL